VRPAPDAVDGLRISQEGPVLHLSIDRPDRRNALTDPIVLGLTDLIDAAGTDESVRVVLLDAVGDHFCSGFDLGTRASGGARPRVGSIQRRMPVLVNRLIPVMLRTQVPIVVAARGYAYGLGMQLLLAADFAVVANDARIKAPFVGSGFTPDSGATWLLPRLAGLARAREVLMLGREVSGSEAAAWGMVHEAVPTDDLDDAAAALAARLAAGPTVALGLTKWLLHRGLGLDLEQHLHEESFAMELSSRSEDFREAGTARREQRDPHFEGR
jgi:2-(1,2-epoxy-1,2-dihydrophenyl)acetyl-CoA isomerase